MKDQFYIGWQENAPSSFKSGRSKFMIVAVLAMIIFTVVYVLSEKKFIDSYFEYGTLTTLKGTMIDYPVYALRTEQNGKIQTIPLVGFGKFSAGPVIEKIKSEYGVEEVSSLKVELQGTLFYYQDKKWMELTEGDESVINVVKSSPPKFEIKSLGNDEISGEIVDPKCFFGVMNPAYKKVHMSCAIRCISGGIPPVLAVRQNGVFIDYYIVLDQSGIPVNQEILDYVGLPVTLKGELGSVDDLKTIKLTSKNIWPSVNIDNESTITMCNDLQK